MLVKWDGEGPPDKGEWIEVLREALESEAGSYWVRFYKEPEGWRFDLEHRQPAGSDGPGFRQADESVALRVYERLVESGKPLDPGWMPLADSSPAPVVPTRPADVPATLPLFAEAPGTRPAEAAPAAKTRATPRVLPSPAEPTPSHAEVPPSIAEPPPAKAPGVAAEAPGARHEGSVLAGAESFEPAPTGPSLEVVQPTQAWRAPDVRTGWRSFRPAVVYLPGVLLVAFGAWLAWQRAQSPASPPAPSPSATANEETLAAAKRLKDLEAEVAQLQEERARLTAGRRSPTPASPGATQRQPRQAAAQQPGDAGAAQPAVDVPLPAEVQVPADFPRSSAATPADEAVVPLAAAATAALPPAPPPPVEPGTLVDVNDPELTRPVALTQTRPVYPRRALERRISGTVWLRALVDETGRVAEVSLVRASAQGLGFEDAAIRHTRSRAYRPATKQGVPVRVWLPIMVEFQVPGR